MRIRSLARLAELTGGNVVGDDAVEVGPDVVIDSREVTPGALFVALRGERVDGHDYVTSAAGRGAAAALVERRLDADVPQLVVSDSVQGLSDLARALVAEARAAGLRTVAITGSSGKTSTKDLVAAVCESAGSTVSPVGSFNNEIGVPLTATRIEEDTRFLVSEMGARGLGHVAWLCSIVPPDVAVVVNVGHAHVGEFGSVAAIAQAKGEIVEALGTHDWAVLNGDDDVVRGMARRSRGRVALFSVDVPAGPADLRVWATDLDADEMERYRFTLRADGWVTGAAEVSLRVLGRHQVSNAVAAAAVGLVLGMPIEQVAAALSEATARSKWRMEMLTRSDGALVLNDSYNANPDSMRAAVSTLAKLRRPGGRLVAVLGDMRELGEAAPESHREIGELAARFGVDLLVAIGDHAGDLLDGFGDPEHSVLAHDKDEALRRARSGLGAADVVLVKASRGVGLDTVAESLAAHLGQEGGMSR